MQMLRIILLCILAAIAYGILHDLVTAHLCVEYFTIGHPPVFPTDHPILLALGWGVIATWWVGMLLGIPLALVARLGHRPRLDAGQLLHPVARLLLIMAGGALLAGVLGYIGARGGAFILRDPLAGYVPADRHVGFITNLWAHSASYLLGFIGGIVLIVRTWRRRGRLARELITAPVAGSQ